MKASVKNLNNLIKTLSLYDIKKVGSHIRLNSIEDEFAYLSSLGEPFHFVILHDGTPKRFVKDFNAMIETFAFRDDAYEQDVKKALYKARNALRDIDID